MKFDNTTEEYLEAIYKLNKETGGIGAVDLAKYFDIRTQSVREKLQRLKKDGYLELGRSTITLTEKGSKRAKDVIRKHRLAERFLQDILKLEWDEVHEEACLFEHTMSEKVADALERFLDYPEKCPHGHPIPDKNGKTNETAEDLALVRLSTLNTGDSAVVKKIDETSSQLLKQLLSLGILPESQLNVKQIAPFKSAYLIEMNNLCCYSLGDDIAKRIWVKPQTQCS